MCGNFWLFLPLNVKSIPDLDAHELLKKLLNKGDLTEYLFLLGDKISIFPHSEMQTLRLVSLQSNFTWNWFWWIEKYQNMRPEIWSWQMCANLKLRLKLYSQKKSWQFVLIKVPKKRTILSRKYQVNETICLVPKCIRIISWNKKN